MIGNKVLVNFLLEDGCSQEEGEVNLSWTPINFRIYSHLFTELIEQACDEWVDGCVMSPDRCYEVIFIHRIERDGAGAVHSEYFEPIYEESGD